VEVTADGSIGITSSVRVGFYPEQDW